MLWFLLFNCTMLNGQIQETNLVFHNAPYQTESACRDEAEFNLVQYRSNPGCYFVCLKGYGRK